MFSKILIANRGEIACRVAATAKRLGVSTVAVYSDADREAKHVAVCDEAIYLGGSAPKDSYLKGDAIIAIAKQTGAEAIHPGYGFLSENADFAQACQEAGLVFIGPSAEAIRAMGGKSESKRLMEAAGVPLIPGYHGDNQDAQFLQQQADDIGYPVLIKASAGGGGKGMRIVEQSSDFIDLLDSCRREAITSFGNDQVLIENMRSNHAISKSKYLAIRMAIMCICLSGIAPCSVAIKKYWKKRQHRVSIGPCVKRWVRLQLRRRVRLIMSALARLSLLWSSAKAR
ncbi:hypothetical protein PKHYL_05550 [Psychrobacter sp. KH172YL61]|nr:hypothetical protein PKHYL_05550 [Psychrobacter sp. KH172YL61]